MEDRVDVVENAGECGILDGRKPAAGLQVAVDREHSQAQAAEIGLQDQPVMAGADDDAVENGVHPYALPVSYPKRSEAHSAALRTARAGSDRLRAMCPCSGRSVGCVASWYRQSMLQRIVDERFGKPRWNSRLCKR